MKDSDDTSSSLARRKGFLKSGKRASAQTSSSSRSYLGGSEDETESRHHPLHHEQDGDWGVGDEVKMGLG